jgi:hypothetical protein
VPIFGDSGVGKPGTDGQLIRVIDLAKKAIAGTVDFGKGIRPHCPSFARRPDCSTSRRRTTNPFRLSIRRP